MRKVGSMFVASTAGSWSAAGARMTFVVRNAWRYVAARCCVRWRIKETERVWQRRVVRMLDQSTQRIALRKLLIWTLPRRSMISGSRRVIGWRSSRAIGLAPTASASTGNGLCFGWTVAGPEDVEIVDYH
jgi:toxin HigB-1